MRLSIKKRNRGFTLIELLVVVGIIALLISIMLPSLGRAREQAKATHCLARLKEFGTGLVSYSNQYNDVFPPASWETMSTLEQDSKNQYTYGWSELLWSYVYREEVFEPSDFPVQRNINGRRWVSYMLCKTSKRSGENSGHYRVYLPSWSYGTYFVSSREAWELEIVGEPNYPNPRTATSFTELRPKLVLMGDANDRSYQGDGVDDDDTSWIDPGEANQGGVDGNRFSDRHYGYTNFLFADMHADKDLKLREELARDWDMNGVIDIEEPEPE